MKAFKCDCCEKHFDYNDSHIQAKTKGKMNELGGAAQYDLCPVCTSEFMDWVFDRGIEKASSSPKQANEKQKED